MQKGSLIAEILQDVESSNLLEQNKKWIRILFKRMVSKKPLLVVDGDYSYYVCPNCKITVDVKKQQHYCSNCAQVLDTEEE